jgi:hypothetical protein
LVAEVGGADQPAPFEDRRMWRLLLAQLHPDAGGDHELFVFACAVKEEVCGRERPMREPLSRRRRQRTEHFLRAWQDEMNRWVSRNRDAIRNSCAYHSVNPTHKPERSRPDHG